MKLHILGSSSKGNCYYLESEDEILIIECGISFQEIRKELAFKWKKIVGCLLTHEHGDHACSVSHMLSAGIDVYMSIGTKDALGIDHHRIKIISQPLAIWSYVIHPFKIEHDAKEPLGFVIEHSDMGRMLFVTDTFYCKYRFDGLNQILIEANYCNQLIMNCDYKDRVYQSHMSLQTCKEFLQANDLSAVNNIVLIHLSNGNSDAALFKKEVHELTQKNITIADKGIEINFNKTPF